MSEQRKGSDITALKVVQEVAEGGGVSSNQEAQRDKLVTNTEEEAGARVAETWIQPLYKTDRAL